MLCLVWVVAHALIGALLQLGESPDWPLRYGHWGVIAFIVQGPLLVWWLTAWPSAHGWVAGAALLSGLGLLVGTPFMTGIFFSLCSVDGATDRCTQTFLLVILIPVGLTIGLLQWLLGRWHATGAGWLVPAQAIGMVAFALIFAQAQYNPGSPILDTIPASVIAGVAYALVTALALPGMRPRS